MNLQMKRRLERLERLRPVDSAMRAWHALDLVRGFGTYADYCTVCELVETLGVDPITQARTWRWRSPDAEAEGTKIASRYTAAYRGGPMFEFLTEPQLIRAHELMLVDLPMPPEAHREFQTLCWTAYHYGEPADSC